MLTNITIKDFAIIEQLDLDLHSGMTVITGETGAGKSIVVDALSYALGARADSGVVRHTAKRAEISATFEIGNLPNVHQWLEEQMLDDEQDCIIRRVINHDGRSKAFVNGQPINLRQLAQLGGYLVDIHGQHEHQSLFQTQTHLQLLDRFAGLSDSSQKMAKLATAIGNSQQQLAQLQSDLQDSNDRKELLNYQLEELHNSPLESAQTISQEHKRAANAAKLLSEGQQSLAALYEDDSSISSQLNAITQQLSQMLSMDDRLQSTHDLLQSALVEVEEATSELRDYLDGLDIDPNQFTLLDDQLSTLHDLSRKHQTSIEQLPDTLIDIEQQLSQLAGEQESFSELEQQLAKQQAQYQKLAASISKKRHSAAKKLEKEVINLIKQLGLGNALFSLHFSQQPDDSYKNTGLETLEFMVSTNPGQKPMPLRKVASGGELSRISLALQVINAQTIQLPTLIFDEVDVGIGGGTAEIVGKLLRGLGQQAQILCVTHQAQVAAQGDQHLQVAKSQAKQSTQTQMLEISGTERVAEIARMIGGVEITEAITNHAKELLKQ